MAAKFSTLQVVGMTALANITNSAVDAGKKIVNALAIEPITSGFSEYELKMNSMRTILSATGESIETVNKYLEELNEYSDKTIYSYSDMVDNISKFTNSGVELEDAVMAIKGISNEAALAGASASQARTQCIILHRRYRPVQLNCSTGGLFKLLRWILWNLKSS